MVVDVQVYDIEILDMIYEDYDFVRYNYWILECDVILLIVEVIFQVVLQEVEVGLFNVIVNNQLF